MKTYTGNCLCGAVGVKANLNTDSFYACHCSMCQKWGGGVTLSVDSGSDVTFSAQEMISVFSSSAWAERGFCKNCGTHLFYRLKANQSYYLPFGLLSGTEDMRFTSQIFIDKKPATYEFRNNTECLTEAEFLKKVGG